MEIQLSDAPSIYVTRAGSASWAVHAEVEGFAVGVTSGRVPAQEVSDPNQLLGDVGIALCPLQISSLSLWLVLTYNSHGIV